MLIQTEADMNPDYGTTRSRLYCMLFMLQHVGEISLPLQRSNPLYCMLFMLQHVGLVHNSLMREIHTLKREQHTKTR